MILMSAFQIRIFYGSMILKHTKHCEDDSSDLKSCSLAVPNKDVLKRSHVQPAAQLAVWPPLPHAIMAAALPAMQPSPQHQPWCAVSPFRVETRAWGVVQCQPKS